MTADTNPMAAAREAWLSRENYHHDQCSICSAREDAFDAGWTAAMAQPGIVRVGRDGNISIGNAPLGGLGMRADGDL